MDVELDVEEEEYVLEVEDRADFQLFQSLNESLTCVEFLARHRGLLQKISSARPQDDWQAILQIFAEVRPMPFPLVQYRFK